MFMESETQKTERSRIAFVAADTPEAQGGLQKLIARYGALAPEEADVIVALGGDGFMLEMLHRHMSRNLPIYGMNRGSVGFLMNNYREDGIPRRIARSRSVTLHPLRMTSDRSTDWSMTLELADAGLYRVKQEGRNGTIGLFAGPALTQMNPNMRSATTIEALVASDALRWQRPGGPAPLRIVQ